MDRNSVKYGIDRCPATKNYTNAVFCRNCDFRNTEGKDCCECSYVKFKQESKQHHRLH
ncbi:MAG TPA: hypothetical protein VNT57_05410 [Desulfobacteria bacterium]|nr:hypothetical protein [Desulfobacteria bacterium]